MKVLILKLLVKDQTNLKTLHSTIMRVLKRAVRKIKENFRRRSKK